MTIDKLNAKPKRDRWGRYLITPRDGGKPVGYTRATTVAETLDDRYNLELWKMRQVAIGLTKRKDLLAKVAADATDKTTVNAACSEAMDAAESGAAANTGTALHRILERVDRQEADLEIPDMFAEVVDRYALALDAAGVRVVPDACEMVHVLDGLAEPIAGMADNHVLIGGRRYIADKKTGSGIDFGASGFAVQLAIYAHATSIYDYDSGTHLDMPEVDRERGLIIHIPAAGGDVSLHWVDLTAGWEALQHALWTRRWRKRRGDMLSAYERPETPDAEVARIEAVDAPRRGPTVADEGAAIAVEKVKTFFDDTRKDPDLAAVMRRWIIEGRVAEVDWTLGVDHRATERRYALSVAARHVAEMLAADGTVSGTDEVARTALALVIGDDAHQPIMRVGALIGTLTIEQARQLYRIANTARLHFADDGTPRLTVAA